MAADNSGDKITPNNNNNNTLLPGLNCCFDAGLALTIESGDGRQIAMTEAVEDS